MKPVKFFTSSEPLDQLTEQFGGQLEFLDRLQKLQLRTVLTYFVLGREMMGDDYIIDSAVYDIQLWQLFTPDEQLQSAIERLRDVTVQDAESLLEALQAQCRYGNAKLKTSTDSMADELLEQGIPDDLAEEVAHILTVVDAKGQRTEHQQWLVSQAHKIIAGKK